MEGLFQTEKGAGLTIGGIPNEKERVTNFGLTIPKGLSFLAYGDFNAEVKGLEDFPEENWPPVAPTHIAFQIMVGCGTLLALAGVLFWVIRYKWKDALLNKKFLTFIALIGPLGFVAVEAGWIVTEVGRQPWIIYNIMRTAQAVSPVPGQIFHFTLFAISYIVLCFAAYWLMKRQIIKLDEEELVN